MRAAVETVCQGLEIGNEPGENDIGTQVADLNPRAVRHRRLHDLHRRPVEDLRHGLRKQVHALRGVNLRIEPQRVRGHHGPFRLRQVHADEPDRLPGHAHQGPLLAERPPGERAGRRRAGPHPQQGNRLRLPDLQPAGPRHRPAQRRAAADLQRNSGGRAHGARQAKR